MLELRIHGVGPQTPEGVLGVGPADVEDAAPGLEARRVWRRKAETATQRRWPGPTQAFMWNELTSSSPFQAFWPILLPFTLINVAGWMHPRADGSVNRATRTRAVVLSLGFAMSATWGLWAAIFIGYATTFTPPDLPDVGVPEPILVGGAIILLGAVMALAVWIFRSAGEAIVDDEAPEPGIEARPAAKIDRRVVLNVTVGTLVAVSGVIALAWSMGPASGPLWWRTAAVTVGLAAVGGIVAVALRTRRDFEDHTPSRQPRNHAAPLGADRIRVESLDDDQFFSREANRKANPSLHIAMMVAGLIAGVIGARWGQVTLTRESLGSVQGSVASLLFLGVSAIQYVLLLVLYVLAIGADIGPSRNLRFRWAAPATTAACAILLGNAVFAGFALALHKVFGIELGPEVALIEAPAIGLLVLVLVAAATAAALIKRKPSGEAGTFVALARLPRHLDVALSSGVVVTLVLSVGWFVTRARDGSLDGDPSSPAATVAAFVFAGAAIAALGFIRKALVRVAPRRQIGVAWDVLSFWPRRFHPFAVRPYSEKIVPQFQDHLVHTLLGSDSTSAGLGDPSPAGVVISAHSQGSVIAYAGLRGVRASLAIDRVALVSFGSPLLRLFARLFPHYIRREHFDEIASPGERTLRSWFNAFHATDPIGQDVFTDPDARGTDATNRDVRDLLLEDPVPTDASLVGSEPPGDGPRLAEAGLALHSFYRNEVAVKGRIRDERRSLAENPRAPSVPAAPGATVDIPGELAARIERLRRARSDDVHHQPTAATPDLLTASVLEEAVRLLEVHWIADERSIDEVQGYRFQKLYSKVPSDPLLRQRSSKDFDLAEPFVYKGAVEEGGAEQMWVVARKPERTDFASIPGFLTWLIPRYGRHTMAALVHDHLQDLLVSDPSIDPTRNDERTVTSTQADYVMRDAMRSSGVPFVLRWIIWTGISVRTLVTKPLDVWLALVALAFVLVYGVGVGVVGFGWLLTLPVIHASGGASWPIPWTYATVAVLSPFVTSVLWLTRWRRSQWQTGVVAAYVLMLVAMPVVFITVARVGYWFAELVAKARPKVKKRVAGHEVTFEHNPISEETWQARRPGHEQKIDQVARSEAATASDGP